MDEVVVSIVSALAGGALAEARKLGGAAVKDCYEALKKLLIDGYKSAAPFVEAVIADPTSASEQEVLAKRIPYASANSELKAAAVALLEQLEALRNDPAAQAVLNFDRLHAAKRFELRNIDVIGTLLKARDATFEGDFILENLTQGPPTKN
jgi:hypothetical protein